MSFKIQRADDNINVFIWDDLHSLDTKHTLHISDIHFDSLKCERELLKKHLEEIKRCDGYVFIYGDWFDVMGCFQDPRSKAKDIDPRYIQKGREYLNLVVEDSIEFLKPYAKNIAFISEGNHETEIKRRRDVDILSWMINALNDNGGNIVKGHYSGWNEFVFRSSADKKNHYNGKSCSLLSHFHHGYGGNAKRSKGMLDAQIASFTYPDCDLIFRGHTHQKFHDPSNIKYLYSKQTKKVRKRNTHYIMTGSYKDATGLGKSGWEVQKGFLPTRMGGWFVDFEFKNVKQASVQLTVREAT